MNAQEFNVAVLELCTIARTRGIDVSRVEDAINKFWSNKEKKYPWSSLKNIGDSILIDQQSETVRNCARNAAKKRGWKLKVKKVKGGCIVRRVA